MTCDVVIGDMPFSWSAGSAWFAMTGSRRPDLETVFARVLQGDAEAVGDLYDLVADELYGFALWVCGRPSDAGDAVQEVFVRLLERRPAPSRVRRPKAYLLRMARSAAVDLARKRGRETSLSDGEELQLLAPVFPAAERAIEAGRLSRLIRRLPRKQRETLYLRIFSGLTFAEIGKVSRVPTFTAASRYRLAMERLRRLSEQGRPE